MLAALEELRQEDQAEEHRPDQGEGCIKSEIPQQVRRSEKQAQECPYRGYAAYDERRGYLFEKLPHILHVVLMGQHVDGIAQGNAHDGSSSSHRDTGNAVLENRSQCQCHHPAVQNRAQNQENRLPPLEHGEDEENDDNQRDYGGQESILLYLPGIIDAHCRATEISDFQIRKHCRHLPYGILDDGNQTVVASGLSRAVLGFDEGQHHFPVRSIDSSVNGLIPGCGIKLGRLGQKPEGQAERV